MSDQPTPETNAAEVILSPLAGDRWVLVGFARKLERERDAERERHATEATEHMLAINKLCNERDEAREELHDIRLNLGEDADGFTLLHAVCALQNERDSLQIALEEISNLAKTLKTERDEAREEAHRFRALHYNHLGINGSASWFPWEGK